MKTILQNDEYSLERQMIEEEAKARYADRVANVALN